MDLYIDSQDAPLKAHITRQGLWDIFLPLSNMQVLLCQDCKYTINNLFYFIFFTALYLTIITDTFKSHALVIWSQQ